MISLRRIRGFTLLELIVVIVILGILASIAIPTFAGVTRKSQDAAKKTQLTAILHDAQALMGLSQADSSYTWATAVETATKETVAPVAYYAADGALTAVPATTDPVSLSTGTYQAASKYVVLSLLSESGSVCVGVATPTTQSLPYCGLPIKDSNGATTKSVAAQVLSDNVVALPSGVNTASDPVAPVVAPVVSTADKYSNAIKADGAASYWTLRQTTGSSALDAAGSRGGTFSNVTLGAGADQFGNANAAAYFNGSSSSVALAGTFGGTAATTVEGWFKTDGPSSDFQTIIGSSSTSFIHLQAHSGGNNAIYYNNSTGLLSPVPSSLSGWHYAAVTSTPGSQILYIDGVPYGSTSSANYGSILASSSVSIGRGFQNGRFFKGYLSDVAVYNKVLTSAQIKAHYDARN